jgi:hypothetical protein
VFCRERSKLRVERSWARVEWHCERGTSKEKSKVNDRTLETEGCGTRSLLATLRVLHPPNDMRGKDLEGKGIRGEG